jgi:hypothetical protein
MSTRPDVQEQLTDGKRKKRRKRVLPDDIFLGIQLRAV